MFETMEIGIKTNTIDSSEMDKEITIDVKRTDNKVKRDLQQMEEVTKE